MNPIDNPAGPPRPTGVLPDPVTASPDSPAPSHPHEGLLMTAQFPPPRPLTDLPVTPPPTRKHYNGTAILVLGVIGLMSGFLLPPISIAAWVMGSIARKQMKAEPNVEWSNKSEVNAGWVTGIIGTLISLAVVLLLTVPALVYEPQDSLPGPSFTPTPPQLDITADTP